MLSQSELKDLTRTIVQNEFPSELTSFDEAGDRWIKRVYQSEGSLDKHSNASQLNFIAEATVVLKFVQVIAATFVALKRVWDAFQTSPDDGKRAQLTAEWHKQLIDAGISPEKANSIVANFSADLLKRLEPST